MRRFKRIYQARKHKDGGVIMNKWNYGIFFVNFYSKDEQESSKMMNNALETLRIINEDTSIYDVVNINDHYLVKKDSEDNKLAPFIALGSKLYVLATSENTVDSAAKYALPLVFKWDDTNEERLKLLSSYNASASKYKQNIDLVRHQLMLHVNVNEADTVAKEELKAYFENYVACTQPSNFNGSIDSIIQSNVTGCYNDCLSYVANLASEFNNTVDFLLCFESMQDQNKKKSVMIELNNQVIKFRQDNNLI
ncbi:hypothetical protein DAT36_04300 [Photobacterium phosphoreum]|jgi:hypothetical protein|nr:LLM class flavin-dependent oxidoreductase [Photobacterium phosphoreum]MCD9501557.1 LLM class flavin-dependent oxidoreductase [Photobacterium phosphoreum]MCF2176152.1 LLM class flavin-dependent oxidoreductase [Photobacterium phosphoreum]PTB33905.1 hypothetical protein DAT36_04300 [Photobacterium phosphoreum]